MTGHLSKSGASPSGATEPTIKERIERLRALEDCKLVIDALHVALGALDHITHCRTLGHADRAARDALVEIESALAEKASNDA